MIESLDLGKIAAIRVKECKEVAVLGMVSEAKRTYGTMDHGISILTVVSSFPF